MSGDRRRKHHHQRELLRRQDTRNRGAQELGRFTLRRARRRRRTSTGSHPVRLRARVQIEDEDHEREEQREAVMADEKKTLVEDGTELKGSISSKCPIVVRGKIDGEVQAPALTVSDTGAVHGTVKVGQMTSQGEISGEFDAESIQLSGTVKDNTIIRAKTLEVKITSATSKMQVVFGE